MLPLVGTSLLIRCYAQQWLREPAERGLHIAGGFLRIGTWWVYTVGFIYAVLNVRVPYIPTPKAEGWLRNEWRVAAPNIFTALLLLAACKYGRMLSLSVYTNVMVGLSLLLASILLAAVAMGQHEALRNFIRDMASRPFRPLVLGLNRLWTVATSTLARGLRRGAVGASGVLVFAQLLLARGWVSDTPSVPWLKTGEGSVHVGLAPAQSVTSGLSFPVVLGGAESVRAPRPEIVPFVLPGTALPELPLAAMRELSAAQVPLLTWSLPYLTDNPGYWRRVARQFRQEADRPVMLRPLFPRSSAVMHKRAWQALVKAFRAEKVLNVTWLWTLPQSGAVVDYCPGPTYLDWLVADHPTNIGNQAYSGLQHQLAEQFELHQKPLLLMATWPANGRAPSVLARRVALHYPEIKAVVYSSSATASPALLVRRGIPGVRAVHGLAHEIVPHPQNL